MSDDFYTREYEADAFWGGDAPRWKPEPLLTPEEREAKKAALQALFDQWTAAGERFRK